MLNDNHLFFKSYLLIFISNACVRSIQNVHMSHMNNRFFIKNALKFSKSSSPVKIIDMNEDYLIGTQ